MVRSIYFPDHLRTRAIINRYAADPRYQWADSAEEAEAVVVDAETPRKEFLLLQGKVLFEVDDPQGAEAVTPAFIDRLTAQGLILPGVGNLIVIQRLTAPEFHDVVLIFV